MARRLIVDTSVLLMSERGQGTLAGGIEADDDLAIAAITVAELRTGVELATEARRAARSEFLVRVLETLPVEPYDLGTAEEHGRLLAHVHREGSKSGAHDLIYASALPHRLRAARRLTLVVVHTELNIPCRNGQITTSVPIRCRRMTFLIRDGTFVRANVAEAAATN